VINPGSAGGGRHDKAHEQAPVVGVPWFEHMLSGSGLGRIKRTRGGGISSDGRSRVEWEVTEWTEGDGNGQFEVITHSTAKRKLDNVDEADSVMDGLH
jgi:hypothetical protein